MSKLENHIGWCDDTGNKVVGCEKVSPGCKNCYAEKGMFARIQRGLGHESWGPKGERIPIADFSAKLRRLNKLCICDACHETQPYARVGKQCGILGKESGVRSQNDVGGCSGTLRRIRFFADSNSDWLDEKWLVETLAEFLNDLRLAPNVDILLLTKRIELWRKRFLQARAVMLKSSEFLYLESIDFTDITDANRFPGAASFDVLTGKMIHHDDDMKWTPNGKIDWMIIGGESGKDRRDCGVRALMVAAEQCVAAGVPVYVKQDCAFKSGQQGRVPPEMWKLKQFPRQASVTLDPITSQKQTEGTRV